MRNVSFMRAFQWLVCRSGQDGLRTLCQSVERVVQPRAWEASDTAYAWRKAEISALTHRGIADLPLALKLAFRRALSAHQTFQRGQLALGEPSQHNCNLTGRGFGTSISEEAVERIGRVHHRCLLD